MSGIVYGLAGFLFTSGVIRKYLPLQALSLFVIFLYGSMIWGVFPTPQPISWEGHLAGLLVGVFLAYWFRKKGPQRPKYQYEIEKELGIEMKYSVIFCHKQFDFGIRDKKIIVRGSRRLLAWQS